MPFPQSLIPLLHNNLLWAFPDLTMYSRTTVIPVKTGKPLTFQLNLYEKNVPTRPTRAYCNHTIVRDLQQERQHTSSPFGALSPILDNDH